MKILDKQEWKEQKTCDLLWHKTGTYRCLGLDQLVFKAHRSLLEQIPLVISVIAPLAREQPPVQLQMAAE